MAIKTSWTAGQVLAAADLTDTFAAKTDLALTQSVKTGDYSFAKADLPNLVVANKSTAIVFTLPTDATVSTWGTGSTIKFLNIGAGVLTITAAGGVTINANTTFATSKGGMLIRTAANAWTLVPFSGGVANAVISSTTGSPAITSYTDTGITYDVYSFAAAGSLIVGTGGVVDVLVCAGGGGPRTLGGYLSSGGGGNVIERPLTLAAGTFPVVVGAGGVASSDDGTTVGGLSSIGGVTAYGNGFGIGTGATPASPNNGVTSLITGSSLTFGRGATASPRANSGDGGAYSGSVSGAAGAVIVRVAR